MTQSEALILRLFPRLTPGRFRVTSPATEDYNCVAWAVGVTDIWYEPGMSWPLSTGYGCLEPELVEFFRLHGFVECPAADLEPKILKVALYSNHHGTWKHVARQLPSGL